MKNNSMKVYFGELFGTFLFKGIGLVSVVVLALGLSDIDYSFMTLAWGIAITIAVCLSESTNGAHMYPAAIVSLTTWNGFDSSSTSLRAILPIEINYRSK